MGKDLKNRALDEKETRVGIGWRLTTRVFRFHPQSVGKEIGNDDGNI